MGVEVGRRMYDGGTRDYAPLLLLVRSMGKIGRDMLSMYIPSLPESTCWLLLRLFSKLPVNLSRRLNSQFMLYDGSESRCSGSSNSSLAQ